MDFTEAIFARADMQQIAEFLLHSCGCAPDLHTYRERTEGTLSRVIDGFLRIIRTGRNSKKSPAWYMRA